MIIKFQIVKTAVLEEVRNATYIKARTDGASDERAAKVIHNEAAGTDDVHERTLAHDFQTALEVLKTFFVDYLVPTPQTIGDNVIYYNGTTDDIVEFTLDVSRRYNGTLTDALARLSAKYVEDYIIAQWWLKQGNLNQAAPYQTALAADEQLVRKCFVLAGPTVPKTVYPTNITVRSDGEPLPGEIEVELGEHNTLSYTLNDGAVDDIEARSSCPHIVSVRRDHSRRAFCLVANNTGYSKVLIFSRHNDAVRFSLDVIVTEEEGYDEEP